MTETAKTVKTVNPREPHAFVPGTGSHGERWCDICDHSADAYVHASETERQAFDLANGDEAKRDTAALAKDREWFGYLTTANYRAVADRVGRMLKGKRYTWVDSDAMGGYRPRIRTGMQAGEITANLIAGSDSARPLADVCVHDSYGIWAIHSSFASQHEAAAADAKRRTYVHFERDRWGDRLQIEHYAISGNHLWWTIAVENSGW